MCSSPSGMMLSHQPYPQLMRTGRLQASGHMTGQGQEEEAFPLKSAGTSTFPLLPAQFCPAGNEQASPLTGQNRGWDVSPWTALGKQFQQDKAPADICTGSSDGITAMGFPIVLPHALGCASPRLP